MLHFLHWKMQVEHSGFILTYLWKKTGWGRNVCAAESDGDIFPVMILCLGGYGGSSSLITPSDFSI